jgi:arginine N-succinyltransferase
MDQGAFVIRPLRASDVDWLYELSRIVEPGLTSLPNDKAYLHQRVETVVESFKQNLPIENRIYLFVRENIPSGDRVGISGIQAVAGPKVPFYSYQISTVSQLCESLDVYLEHKILNVVNNFQTATELISFWLHPDYRGKSLSKCLSLSRFLFMAQFPQFFGKEVIAEIRGVCDAAGNSPFWESIGRHFFAMDFKRADHMTMSMGKQYISDLMPRMPIYVELLSAAAQQVIGVPHATAAAAEYFLKSEGFKFNNHIDIFDGGPLINAEMNKIKTVTNSKLGTVSKVQTKIENCVEVIISNINIDIRITFGKITILDNGELVLPNSLAKILEVTTGDQVRYCLI